MGVRNDWRVNGAAGLVAALEKGAAQTPLLMAAVVEKTSADLVALTQQNASGRPGPNAPTGDYRGSWRVEPVRDGVDEVSRGVGTDRPQARRLEYGYVGPDSLGRTFDQQPYPHHGPAVDVTEPVFYAAMEAVSRQATSW
jgi:hypothetical protein